MNTRVLNALLLNSDPLTPTKTLQLTLELPCVTEGNKRALENILSTDSLQVWPQVPVSERIRRERLEAIANAPGFLVRLAACAVGEIGLADPRALARQLLEALSMVQRERECAERYIQERDTAQATAEQATINARKQIDSFLESVGLGGREFHLGEIQIALHHMRRRSERFDEWAGIFGLEQASTEEVLKELRRIIAHNNLNLAKKDLDEQIQYLRNRKASYLMADLRSQAGYMLSQRMADDDTSLMTLFPDWENMTNETRERWCKAAETITAWGAAQQELQEQARIKATNTRIHINGIDIFVPLNTSAAMLCATIEIAEKPKTANEFREWGGKLVREVWLQWASEQPDVGDHPNWLKSWAELSERDREVDRRIATALAFYGKAVVSNEMSGDLGKLPEVRRALVTRANAWTPPANKALACFIGLRDEYQCLNCGKDVSAHYGDLEYRCEPLE